VTHFISIIIPNHNSSNTIGKCLEAALASSYEKFEVVVIDDCSEDNSVEIISQFPCKLIRLDKPSGASKARNIGAFHSHGDILFFTDADCLLKKDTLCLVAETFSQEAPDAIIGGTYTPIPYDHSFFSIFQSIFIHYFETKQPRDPDYIATHAMAIDATLFSKIGGFSENFLPILEDVELSHRLRRSGYRLIINPHISVLHIFNFSLIGSLHNAIRKSMYWTLYSINNRDLLADSGTASVELKINVASQLVNLVLLVLWILSRMSVFIYPLALIFAFNVSINAKLIRAFYAAKGFIFAGLALIYYTMIYSLAVAVGALAGVLKHYGLGFYKGRS
jgi:glycosyltransferase involved in cell wall biosynthesis